MQEVFPFLVGCDRSGTTLLKEMLNSHPDLAVPPESEFVPVLTRNRARYETEGGFNVRLFVEDLDRYGKFERWPLTRDEVEQALIQAGPMSTPEAMRSLYSYFASRVNKPRYGDKTPYYVCSIPQIAAAYPESRFVHIVRDGRNVALSLIEMPWAPSTVMKSAIWWRHRVRTGRRDGSALGWDRYMEVLYEELVAHPEQTLRSVCDFLDLEYSTQMLRYTENAAVRGRPHQTNVHKPPTAGLRDWRTQMRPKDVAIFELYAGDALRTFGYETGARATIPMRAKAKVRHTTLKRVGRPIKRLVRGGRASRDHSGF
jgi:hypothetical protein